MLAVEVARSIAFNEPACGDPFLRQDGELCDGYTDDTQSLQRILTDCRGLVTIAAGANCTTLPLILFSNTWLNIQPGARLQAANKSQWPDGAPPMLSSTGTRNVTISGKGTLDGHGEQWWPIWPLRPPDSERPKLIELNGVNDVRLNSFTLLNPARFAIDIKGGRDYRIYDLVVRAPDFQIAPNTDGIDIAATNVHVQNVDVQNGDDSLCVKSPAANVLIENSVVRYGNGLVVGTSFNVAIHNITFRNCTAIDTTFGCHIKFRPPETGFVSNITFEDISITQTSAATWRRLSHFDHRGYGIGIHQSDQGRRRLEELRVDSQVQITNITYRRIRANVLYAGEFKCGKGNLTCSGLRMEDVQLNASRQGCIFQHTTGISTNVSPPSCKIPEPWKFL